MPTANISQGFIPQERPTVPISPRGQGRGLAELLVLISIVLFVASVALAAGVFLYGQFLESSARSKINQLERAKAAFEPSLIHELSRLDDRMRTAGDILGRHIAPSVFFKMLELTTISTVAYTSLDFNSDREDMTIAMDGVAASVNSIALQADLFSKGGVVTSPIFSNIDRKLDGVHFTLSALVNPAAITYVQAVSGATPSGSMAPSVNLSPFVGSSSETVPEGESAGP